MERRTTAGVPGGATRPFAVRGPDGVPSDPLPPAHCGTGAAAEPFTRPALDSKKELIEAEWAASGSCAGSGVVTGAGAADDTCPFGSVAAVAVEGPVAAVSEGEAPAAAAAVAVSETSEVEKIVALSSRGGSEKAAALTSEQFRFRLESVSSSARDMRPSRRGAAGDA